MMCPRDRERCEADPRAGRARGFSLLEIIVVLSIMAIITASIVPVFSSSFSGLKHNNALRNMVSLIKFVQEKSVAESQVYRICFDTDENAFWVMQPAEEPTEDRPFETVLESYGRRKNLPSGMEFRNVNARTDRIDRYEYFECYPSGACDRLEIDFAFPRDSSRSAKISVNGMLGRVALKE